MSAREQYNAFIKAADPNDRRMFDAHLLGYLLHACDAETLTQALEAAAADVNAVSS